MTQQNQSVATRMINEFYDDMNNEDQMEVLSMKLSVSAKASDVTMLDAIASNFNKTRTEIVSELLNTAVLEMFFALTSEDKAKISEIADKETTAYYAKKGVKQFYAGVGLEQGDTTDEDMTWRGFNAMIEQHSKEEQKDANS